MKYNSICKWMTEAAETIPDHASVKLFLRHSIRYDDPIDGNYTHLMLTPEGIHIAHDIGKSLDLPIGNLYSSPVRRCQQTAYEIKRAANNLSREFTDFRTISNEEESEYGIKIKKNLGHLHGLDYALKELNIGWYEFFYYLQREKYNNIGNVTHREVVAPILDAILEDKTSSGTVDIICTHDSHIVSLASYLFDYKTGKNGENWCDYTEGIFFYENNNEYIALWRGEAVNVKNCHIF